MGAESTTYETLIAQIARMPADSPERRCYEAAKGMFEFLVRRESWLGCRDWAGLAPEVRGAFMDMAALYGKD